MSIRRAFKPYLQVRPVGMRNAVRLYAAYTASLLTKLLAPSQFKSVGHLIPGKTRMTVSIGGILANARPRTYDLAVLAGTHELNTVTWFHVKPGDIVVDVGAHIGRYTLAAARHASKVVAIEPEPSNFRMLQANIRLNRFSNVTALHLALSKYRGKHRLYLANMGDPGHSSLEADLSGMPDKAKIRDTIEVECETLDHLVALLNLETIDWLKIDVEGHEVSVLESGRSTLTKTKHLILEVARWNEKACNELLDRTGLELVSVEKSKETSNWLLVREP